MNSLVLIDKPNGPTSNQVTAWVKDIFNEKCTHCGTLDPQVSGVLPILIGNKAIKLQEYLLKHDKEYIVLATSKEKINKENFQETLKEFTGKIYQKPPRISAVAKKIRVRQIYESDLLESTDNKFLFKVVCQHGTYIRTLISDMSKVLGTELEMTELRRTRAGIFREHECISLTKLRDLHELGKTEDILWTLEQAIAELPSVTIKKKAAENIIKGAPLYLPGFIEKKGSIQKGTSVAMFQDNQLIAIGTALVDETKFSMSPHAIIKTDKVII